MSESTPRRPIRRRSERTEQLYYARTLPDADDFVQNEPQPAAPDHHALSASRRMAYEQRFQEPEAAPAQPAMSMGYDESLFTPNEPDAGWDEPEPVPAWEASADEAPTYEAQPVDDQQPAYEEPALPEDEPWEPEQAPDHSTLTANLSAYYRRAANVSADAFDEEWQLPGQEAAWDEAAEDDPAAAMNIYRPLEASWAQEERQSMMEDAGGYQVKTEERKKPGKRRRRKRLLRRGMAATTVVAVLAGAAYLYLSHRQPEESQPAAANVPVVTATPQPVRGYDAAPAMQASEKATQAIDQISGPVEMATCAVTTDNILTRSMRADGLYDFYLFAADGRLLAYFDGLPADGMQPMEGGGFHVQMPPYLVDEEGRAMIAVEGIEAAIGSQTILRPLLNGWARIVASDGESNFISPEGQLLSRLWFCRSFAMTGENTVGYVDTGVAGDDKRYTLYIVSGQGSTVKWQDAADDRNVVTAALDMAYLQNGDLYRLSHLLEDPAAAPLCQTDEVRFYADCNAAVVRDGQSGKYALYVNGEKHYDAVYDSILPVESDVRWQGQPVGGQSGQATVLTVTGAGYPQPLSYYFVLSRDGAEEYVALSAASTCPILPD